MTMTLSANLRDLLEIDLKECQTLHNINNVKNLVILEQDNSSVGFRDVSLHNNGEHAKQFFATKVHYTCCFC